MILWVMLHRPGGACRTPEISTTDRDIPTMEYAGRKRRGMLRHSHIAGSSGR
jgi:hypothetical protein